MIHYDMMAQVLRDRHEEMLSESQRARVRRAGAAKRGGVAGSIGKLAGAVQSILG